MIYEKYQINIDKRNIKLINKVIFVGFNNAKFDNHIFKNDILRIYA